MGSSEFISTSIGLGNGSLLTIKLNSSVHVDDFLNCLQTICYNLENYAIQLHQKGYDSGMISDMENLLNIANIIGIKWTGIKNGKQIDIDFNIFGGTKF